MPWRECTGGECSVLSTLQELFVKSYAQVTLSPPWTPPKRMDRSIPESYAKPSPNRGAGAVGGLRFVHVFASKSYAHVSLYTRPAFESYPPKRIARSAVESSAIPGDRRPGGRTADVMFAHAFPARL